MKTNSNISPNSIPELSLNKGRFEAFSDAIFAIIMTLLVIEIKIPEKLKDVDSHKLIDALLHEKTLFLSYFLTFAILSVMWLSHHFLFLSYAKNIDRTIVQLNALFLSFLALIPFSSHLLGEYIKQPVAIFIFGLNTLLCYCLLYIMQQYILKAKHIENTAIPSRVLKQSKIRSFINIVFTALGMIVGFLSPISSIFLFIIPIIFNIIPGTLSFFEKLLKLEIN
jgi:uncharacterized membrane protein